MRNTYVKQGILKLPRPRQFYTGFAVGGMGSWSKHQYLKDSAEDLNYKGKPKRRLLKK